MNAYETAQRLGLVGTDQQIVDSLKAIKLHRRDAYITGGPADTPSINLLHLLTARHKVMGMDAEQNWVGPLITLEQSSPEVAGMMAILRTQLQVNDTKVLCSIDEPAADMLNALTAIVGQLTGKGQQVVAEVAILTGGRIGAEFETLTAAEYDSQRQALLDGATTKTRSDAIDQAAAAAQQRLAEGGATTANLIAIFTTTLQQHWS